MINLIRADIYRIVRGKALYITFALVFVLVLLEVLLPGGTIGINNDVIDTDFGQQTVTGAVAARSLLTMADNLVYFLIPLFIAVAMTMFSCGAVKNSLSTGMSRTRLYFSKLLLSSLMCVVLMLFYVTAGVAVATLARGFGTWTGPYLLTILHAIGAQVILLLAFNSVGVFLTFVVRNPAAVPGIYIAFALVPAIVIAVLGSRVPSLPQYFAYDMALSMKLFSYIENMNSAEIVKGLAIGVGFLLVSTAAGIALFRRVEVK